MSRPRPCSSVVDPPAMDTAEQAHAAVPFSRSRNASRREEMYFYTSSVLGGKLPQYFAPAVGRRFCDAQYQLERQKWNCLSCWTQSKTRRCQPAPFPFSGSGGTRAHAKPGVGRSPNRGDRRGSWPRPPAGTCRAALVRPPCGVALMIGGSEPQAFRGLSSRWLLRRPAAGPTGSGCIGPPQMLLSSWVVPAWHLRVSSLLAAPRITGRWAAAQLSTPEVRKQWGRGY